jgi:hypothetical protein
MGRNGTVPGGGSPGTAFLITDMAERGGRPRDGFLAIPDSLGKLRAHHRPIQARWRDVLMHR